MTLMIKSLFALSCTAENSTFPVLVRNTKIMEEVGEFSEALLHKLGYLPHKTMKEPLEGEAADIIICVIDTLAAAYPELSPDELTVMLADQLLKKSRKWVSVMVARNSDVQAD